jgi:hypothetical protein
MLTYAAGDDALSSNLSSSSPVRGMKKLRQAVQLVMHMERTGSNETNETQRQRVNSVIEVPDTGLEVQGIKKLRQAVQLLTNEAQRKRVNSVIEVPDTGLDITDTLASPTRVNSVEQIPGALSDASANDATFSGESRERGEGSPTRINQQSEGPEEGGGSRSAGGRASSLDLAVASSTFTLDSSLDSSVAAASVVYLLSSSVSAEHSLLSSLAPRHSYYLLYWYKSTNTDAEGAASVMASSKGSPTSGASTSPLSSAHQEGGVKELGDVFVRRPSTGDQVVCVRLRLWCVCASRCVRARV